MEFVDGSGTANIPANNMFLYLALLVMSLI